MFILAGGKHVVLKSLDFRYNRHPHQACSGTTVVPLQAEMPVEHILSVYSF
jgi:hypothetical protein